MVERTRETIRQQSGFERKKDMEILDRFNLRRMTTVLQWFPNLVKDFLRQDMILSRKRETQVALRISVEQKVTMTPMLAITRDRKGYWMHSFMEWRDKKGKPDSNNTIMTTPTKISPIRARLLMIFLSGFREETRDRQR